MNLTTLKRFFSLHAVPSNVVAATAFASYGALVLLGFAKWPVWALAVITALFWIPVLGMEMAWAYRNYGWLSFFYLVFLSQLGHFAEHVLQMYQIHILGMQASQSHGLIGPLDIEWVHVVFNTWVLFGAIVLLTKYRKSPWLWITLVAAVWHEIEHLYIITYYIQTGIPGNPGLLSKGGALLGGFNITRPNMHFIYNVIETFPLVVAFLIEVSRTYNEWLAKALPEVEKKLLVKATEKLETIPVKAGEAVVRQGEAADRFYVITRGEFRITVRGQNGEEVEVSRRSPGEFFGEIGLLSNSPRTANVIAVTDGEVIALGRETFASIVDNSQATAAQLSEAARERLARLASA